MKKSNFRYSKFVPDSSKPERVNKPIYVVLGAKYTQIPLIKAAQARGLWTLAFDFSKDPVGMHVCDEFYNISYSDEDKIIEIVSARNIVGVGTVGNDTICIASRLNQRLGLKGLYDNPDIIERANYKYRWKEFLKQEGIEGIAKGYMYKRHSQVLEDAPNFRYPLIFKPADSSGCKGVTVVDKGDNLLAAFNKAYKYAQNQTVIVEEYIGNNSYAVESFVRNGVVQNLIIANRKIPPPPICVGLGLTMPTKLDPETKERVLQLNSRAIRTLALNNGPVHIDMVINPEGMPFIIDIAPRLIAGPAGWVLIDNATGFNVLEATLDISLGHQIKPVHLNSNGRFYAHRYITALKSGELEHVEIDQSLHPENIMHCEILVKSGDRIAALDDSSNRYGYVTAQGDDYDEVCEKIDDFVDHISLKLKK